MLRTIRDPQLLRIYIIPLLTVTTGSMTWAVSVLYALDLGATLLEVNLITTVANQAAVAILNTELMVKTKVIQEELETRKFVERAKEILIKRRNLNADEAFRWIQKRSMDSRKSMRQIAEAILLSEELG